MRRRYWIGGVFICLLMALGGCNNRMENETGGQQAVQSSEADSGYFGVLEEYGEELEYSMQVNTAEKIRYQAESGEELQGYQATLEIVLPKEEEEQRVVELIADILHHEMAINQSNVAECTAAVSMAGREQELTLRFTSKERTTLAAYKTQEFLTEEPLKVENAWIQAEGFYIGMELSADSISYQAPEDKKELSGVTKEYEIVFFHEAARPEILKAIQAYAQVLEEQEAGAGPELPKPVERTFQVYQYDEIVQTIALRYGDGEMKKRMIYDAESDQYWDEEEWGKG